MRENGKVLRSKFGNKCSVCDAALEPNDGYCVRDNKKLQTICEDCLKGRFANHHGAAKQWTKEVAQYNSQCAISGFKIRAGESVNYRTGGGVGQLPHGRGSR